MFGHNFVTIYKYVIATTSNLETESHKYDNLNHKYKNFMTLTHYFTML